MRKTIRDPSKVAPSPNWTLADGISYSLLTRFINCRERFRLYSVEGLREAYQSKHGMDFGTYFHDLLRLHTLYPQHSAEQLVQKCKKSLTPELIPVAQVVFDKYLAHFASEERYNYLAAEDVFDVKYQYYRTKKMRLRGRFDEIIKRPNGSIWIQENKTKTRINMYQIESGVPFNLQTMFYATTASLHYNRPVTGIVYNVIRKPSQSQKKSETEEEFISRLADTIEDDPHHFFHRFIFELPPDHLATWQKQVLNPLLRSVDLWWNSVKNDPFSPWTDARGQPNPHHWIRPFGVYDSMTTGNGDYFDLITRGSRQNLRENVAPFEELRDDE